MYGVIDIGSNTIRLTVYRIREDHFKPLFHNKVSAGLASYIVNGRMPMEGIQKASSVLYELVEIANSLNIKDLYVFATASLRNISNSVEATTMIEQMTGTRIDLLPGEVEGRLGFKGAMYHVDLSDGVLVDIGGGSTELVPFFDKAPVDSVSVDVGSLNMYSTVVGGLLPTPTECKVIRKHARKKIAGSGIDQTLRYGTICGVGGSMRAALKLNNFYFNQPPGNNKMPVEHLDEIVEVLLSNSSVGKALILKVCPDRIHTVLPGLCIIQGIVRHFGANTVVVSDYAVREGYLVSRAIEGREAGHTVGEINSSEVDFG